MGDSDNMTNASVKPALTRIEKMEEKIEEDVAEIKKSLKELKNGNSEINNDSSDLTETEEPDCLCEKTKEELEKIDS